MTEQLITRKHLESFEYSFKVELARLRSHHDRQFSAINDQMLRIANKQQHLEDLQAQIHNLRTFIHQNLQPNIELCLKTGETISHLLAARASHEITNDPDQKNQP